MKQNLENETADKINLNKVRWTNFPNKIWQREFILLILHQEGAKTKSQLVEKGFPQYLIERHLDYFIKTGKIKEDEQTMKYSRTAKKHKFHYDYASGKLE